MYTQTTIYLKENLNSGDPYMTFEVKLLITFVATRPLVILSYMITQCNL